MLLNNKLVHLWKEAIMPYFMLQSENLPVGTEKNNKKKSGKVVSVSVKIQPEYCLYTIRSIITQVKLHGHYSTSLQVQITFCVTTHHQLLCWMF